MRQEERSYLQLYAFDHFQEVVDQELEKIETVRGINYKESSAAKLSKSHKFPDVYLQGVLDQREMVLLGI